MKIDHQRQILRTRVLCAVFALQFACMHNMRMDSQVPSPGIAPG